MSSVAGMTLIGALAFAVSDCCIESAISSSTWKVATSERPGVRVQCVMILTSARPF